MTRLTRRTVLGGTLGLAGLGLSGAAGFSPALAAPKPTIISCGTWGAKAAKGSISMVGPPTEIVVHHTSSANVTDYSKAAAYDIARQIQSWHFDNGWADTGQHFTVSRGGYILEGRHRTLEGLKTRKKFPQGAHTSGQNPHAIGIENQGNYNDGLPPTKQWNALVDLLAYLCSTYGLKPSDIKGHRDFNNTDCPGSAFYAKLPQLRKDVAAKLGTGGGGDDDRPWPKLKAGAKGFRVTAAQYLLRAGGQSVKASGTFDAATTKATKAFQSAKKLDSDGVIGELTWEKLATKVREGSRGDAVKALQVGLTERGHKVTADGVFGSGTAKAVKAFQKSASLGQDGVVGPDTWSNLLRS